MSNVYKLNVSVKQILADTITPVGIYLRIRDRFPGSILLESADYQPGENCFSYICFDTIARFSVDNKRIVSSYPDGQERDVPVQDPGAVLVAFKEFFSSFEVDQDKRYKAICNGLFGYSAYDAVEYFEDIKLTQKRDSERNVPDMFYSVYRYIVAINHYKHETFLLENCLEDESVQGAERDLEELEQLLKFGDIPRHGFKVSEEEVVSNFTEQEHREMITATREHTYRGDVFQIVPSRRFEQKYEGDDFNVYRALRVINPSPYLFYYDCGGFRIFGSSPEAELIVEDGKATLYPIAGTCKRTGDEDTDLAAVEKLKADPKENAEHVMLVDLARNDLSIHCDNVQVESLKEIHFFSHVIHLVSKVSGQMHSGVSAINLLADTFPAGTLSGAPKYRAMELIDKYEKGRRGVYGGAIGYLGFNGSCNHAIVIRSFLSKNSVLYRQAGGGVVADSEPQSEVDEVRNKLEALKKALDLAEEF